jgi:predicted dehydrogenase
MGDVPGKFRVAVVGCTARGEHHARGMASLPEYEIVAACDLDLARAERFADAFPASRPYTEYARMLSLEAPDVVVATNTSSHAELTIQAVQAGGRGVCCEKPMATSMAEGRAMLDACERNGAALAVSHQRRTEPVFLTMRRLIDEGAIGHVELVRGSCAGDVLSDGTHLVDTIRHLAHDGEVGWVFGQVCRDEPPPDEPRSSGYPVSGGWRYGHPVETGAFGLFEFEGGLRAEVHTGSVQIRGRAYQDYEVFGSEGRLHRPGDRSNPPLLIQNGRAGGWTPVDIQPGPRDEHNYELFARMMLDGADHPLAGRSALKDLEIVMAIYEAARRRARLELPLHQPRFPLELMIEAGEL